MIQAIIDGILDALLEAYPEIPVHAETVKQGLKEPCFLVQVLNPANQLFRGKKYHRTNLFSVQYFPESDTDAKAECNAVTDTLFQALELITVNRDLVRGIGMRSEYHGGVLTFFVNYNLFVVAEDKTQLMEVLETQNLVN